VSDTFPPQSFLNNLVKIDKENDNYEPAFVPHTCTSSSAAIEMKSSFGTTGFLEVGVRCCAMLIIRDTRFALDSCVGVGEGVGVRDSVTAGRGVCVGEDKDDEDEGCAVERVDAAPK